MYRYQAYLSAEAMKDTPDFAGAENLSGSLKKFRINSCQIIPFRV